MLKTLCLRVWMQLSLSTLIIQLFMISYIYVNKTYNIFNCSPNYLILFCSIVAFYLSCDVISTTQNMCYKVTSGSTVQNSSPNLVILWRHIRFHWFYRLLVLLTALFTLILQWRHFRVQVTSGSTVQCSARVFSAPLAWS